MILPILLMSIFFLSACSIDNSSLSETTTITEASFSAGTIAQNVPNEELQQKVTAYSNPKRATLRRTTEWSSNGKAYMQYDKKKDKTYFWVELTNTRPDEKRDYEVWLVDTNMKTKEDNRMYIGDLQLNVEGNGRLYYEFDSPGNKYNYLKVELITKGGEACVFNAHFNSTLN